MTEANERTVPVAGGRQGLQILEVERFAIHDGPGIRSVVFFKGCPLRCPWCANPESQEICTQLMHNRRLCAKCGACAAACPAFAVMAPDAGYPEFSCRGKSCGEDCGKVCAEACPAGAIRFSGKWRTVKDVIAEAMRDVEYYRASGGGLTVSGGEPFFQPGALMALLREAKQKGLRVLVETCGQAPQAVLREAEPYIDAFYFDYKHSSAEILRKVTGADPELIYKNLLFLAGAAPQKITVRVPVIPGFNFSAEVISGIYDTVLALNLREVRLLPYHTLGAGKYAQLGRGVRWQASGAPQSAEMLELEKMGEGRGINMRG